MKNETQFSVTSVSSCLPAIGSTAAGEMVFWHRVGTTIAFCLLPSAFFLFTACVRRETAVETGIRTQTLHIGIRSEPPDLDPENTTYYQRFVDSALFEGLVRLGNDGMAIRPGVADRWDISDDGLRYTFHLRPDARWSNGDRVTAADFLATYQRFLDPRLGAEEPSRFLYSIVGAPATGSVR